MQSTIHSARGRALGILALATLLLGSVTPAATAAATSTTQPRSASPVAAATATKLTFRYATGWSTQDRSALVHFIATAYPVLVSVYGPPAQTFTVTIVRDDALDGWAFFRPSWRRTSSGYVLSGAIHISRVDASTTAGRLEVLLHEILHAFHTPYILARDADEEGFAEAAARIAAARVAPLVGVVDYQPAPAYDGHTISPFVGADELNDPVFAAPSFYNPDGYSRPQGAQMYEAAAVYWTTLVLQRPSFFRDFNARWYRNSARSGSLAVQTKAVDALTSALVPRVGTIDIATWRNLQQIRRSRHAAGIHLLCRDMEPQVAEEPDVSEWPTVMVWADLVQTNTSMVDRSYKGLVDVTITGPDGVVVDEESGSTTGSLWQFGMSRVPAAGAYRFRVTAQGADGLPASDSCWAIAGVASAGRLLVIGTPGKSVTAKVAIRDAATGATVRASQMQLVAADGLAIFEGVLPGLAQVGLTGALPLRVVPVGTGGAIVALTPAN